LGAARALGQNWPADLHLGPANAGDHGLFNHVPEEIGWTGFVFACLQDRQGPLRTALLTAVFFWLYHVPGLYLETGSSLATAAVLGSLLLSHLASRFIVAIAGHPNASPVASTTAQRPECRSRTWTTTSSTSRRQRHGRPTDR
jgi:hypothetical protein